MSIATEWRARDYEQAALEYARSLPLEHYMEATSQSMQREITVESLAVLKTRRPDVQYFNELLVQLLHEGKLVQVVPDNMIILSATPSRAKGSFAVALEPAPPFIVFEYVSPSNPRKDYDVSFRKYERALKVPYCMMFYPDKLDLRVHRHTGEEYERLPPDAAGRFAIPELELQVGLVDVWVRYWHQGQLLELPGELGRRVQAMELELANKEATVVRQQKQLEELLTQLRGQVEARARKAGRQDILDQLAGVTDTSRLMGWLGELP